MSPISPFTCLAILFDLDGTLLDTAPEFTFCLNKLLQEEGKGKITVDELKSSISFGAKGMIELAFNMTETDPSFQPLKQRFLDIYKKDLGFQTKFFPGMTEILTLINSLGLRWGIVTNKPQAYTLPLIEKFPPLKQAHCVIAGDTLSSQKPDPTGLLYACQTLKVSPAYCWYVGDAKTDIQAGQRAGMRCAIAHYGYIPKNENVHDWEADCYLASPLEIKNLVSPLISLDPRTTT